MNTPTWLTEHLREKEHRRAAALARLWQRDLRLAPTSTDVLARLLYVAVAGAVAGALACILMFLFR